MQLKFVNDLPVITNGNEGAIYRWEYYSRSEAATQANAIIECLKKYDYLSVEAKGILASCVRTGKRYPVRNKSNPNIIELVESGALQMTEYPDGVFIHI